MRTLREVIQIRQHKYDKDRRNITCSESWRSYMDGWYSAYGDLTEILEQNGFDLDVVVVEDSDN